MNVRIAAFLLAVCALGCPPKRIDFGARGEIQDPDELLRVLSEVEGKVYGVHGEAKISVDSPQAKGLVTLFVAVMHPSLIHVESLSFFGKPEAVLVSDGKTFGLYSEKEGKYFTGPASPQNVSRFLPVVLAPEELVALMLGRAPRIVPERKELSIDPEKKAYRLVLQKGRVTQTLWVHPSKLRVLESEIRGVESYDLFFEDIDDLHGVTYPRRVELKAPSAATTVALIYKDVTVNDRPDLTLFEMAPPANVPVVEVDERGVPREGSAGAN